MPAPRQRWLFVAAIGFASLAMRVLPAKPPSLRFSLEKIWEVSLPADQRSPIFATCENGTIYAVNGQRFSVITPDGQIAGGDQNIDSDIEWTAIACNARKRLVSAGTELSVFSVGAQGALTKISDVPLKMLVQRLLVAPDGTIYAIAIDGSLIAISSSGDEVLLQRAAAPPAPKVQVSLAGAGYYAVQDTCALAWDSRATRLVYMLPGREIRFRVAKAIPAKDAFTPKPSDVARCEAVQFGALFSLPDGRLAEVWRYSSEIASELGGTEISILDSSLKPVARPIVVNDASRLIGTAGDHLYFASFDASKNAWTLTMRVLIQIGAST